MNTSFLPVGICAHLNPSMMSRHALDTGYHLDLTPITVEHARELAPQILGQFSTPAAASCISYRNSADVISSVLGVRVPHNRALVSLEVGDSVLLAHLSGLRLPEHAVELPEGTHLAFYLAMFSELTP